MQKIQIWPIFEQFLLTRNAEATRRAYRWPCYQFQKYLESQLIKCPWDAVEKHLMEFFFIMRGKHKESTTGMVRNALNALYFWGKDFGMTDKVPSRALNRIKLKIWHNPFPFTQEDREKILHGLRYRDYSEARLSTAVLLGMHQGLRVGEICGLKWHEIDLEAGILRFIGKGSRPASVRLGPSVQAALSRLSHLQQGHFGDKRLVPVEWVFASARYPSRKPTTRHFQESFKILAKECKIARYVRFHHLRHTFGTSLVEAGGDVFDVREAMRLSDLNTALHYVGVDKKRHSQVLSRVWANEVKHP